MKSIKGFGFSALVAMLTMAFVGASSAVAGSTALCKKDEAPCAAANRTTHWHLATSAELPSLILTSDEITIECAVLFLSTNVGGLGSPQVIKGNFTYSNCNNGCSVTEENGPSELKLLRTGAEKAAATLGWLSHLECGFYDCYYVGEGLKGTFKGALSPFFEEEDWGEAELNPEAGGFFCPAAAELDLWVFSLETFYIST